MLVSFLLFHWTSQRFSNLKISDMIILVIMACDSRQNSTSNSVLRTFHFVTQIVFCIQVVKIKFYFVFQILFCFELCSLNSVLSPKFYFVFQILFCFELCSLNSVLSPKFYFVFQILFCFELCSLNSVLSPKFYFTLKCNLPKLYSLAKR